MEIELKFLLQPDLVTKFTSLIDNAPFEISAPNVRHLRNGYFDTDQKALRQFDIGLRIRSCELATGEKSAEQTVKLAGQDVGGLHQRPEFNVDLPVPTNMVADLSLYEREIWPAGFDVDEIQQQLMLLFETDFQRTTWHVSMPSGTVIECVLDQGAVKANGQETIISEVELELVSGEVKELFAFAQYIASKVDVRLGFLSKAARGYHLLAGKSLSCVDLNKVNVKADDAVETAFVKSLTAALKFVQHNEQVFCASMSPKSLRKVLDGWSLIIHVMQLFADLIPTAQAKALAKGFKMVRKQHKWADSYYQINQLTSRKSPFKKDIDNSEFLTSLVAQEQWPEHKLMRAVGFFSSREYNQLILNFIQWLSGKAWRNELSLEQLTVLSQPIYVHTQSWLDASWHNLKAVLAAYKLEPDQENLEAIYWPLVESLLTGIVASNVFGDEAESVTNAQMDLLMGCEEYILLSRLESLLVEHQENHQVTPENDYLGWLKAKQSSLNMAIVATVGNVSQLKPYW